MANSYALFATCPKGIEYLLLDELQSLGAESVKETVAGIHFSGDLQLIYRVCMWSRLANRLFVALVKDKPCQSVDQLYNIVRNIDWPQHFDPNASFAVNYAGQLTGVKHTHFGALKAKDAIVDCFKHSTGVRPNVDPKTPDILINVHAHRGKLTVNIDLSGESLHRRGYRQNIGAAPLKENLAAALLTRADWPGVAARGGALLDPMCGTGTFLIEAAMMAMGIAPGVLRQRWGFLAWKEHQPQQWQAEVEQARSAKQQAMQKQWPEIRGYDSHPKAIESANLNIERAGLAGKVRVTRKDISQFTKPTHTTVNIGLIICNPPYGERLGDADSLVHLYQHLGQRFKTEFPDWKAAVFTGNPELGRKMGIRSDKQYQFFNGPIKSKLLMFSIEDKFYIDKPAAAVANSPEPATLSEGAQMFANRLRKNMKNLAKWVKQQDLQAYRLYDADMPEYAVAVDKYDQWVHVSEYRPPAKVSEDAAAKRLDEVLAAIPQVLDVPSSHIVLKQRSKQKGKQQYQRVDQANELVEIKEGQAKVLVNLHDYLDTGLFLDHRPVRKYIAEHANKKAFLNLFCYTAVASVQAAVGGAKLTDSVDLSSTYLKWARKNLSLNGFSETNHRLHRADCREWLESCEQRYDLILLDPPSFSNSKKMEGVLDIQRDHVDLIKRAMALLNEEGLLIFSNNLRSFKLHEDELSDFSIKNKSKWSLDKDFQRSQKIHQCWFIRKP